MRITRECKCFGNTIARKVFYISCRYLRHDWSAWFYIWFLCLYIFPHTEIKRISNRIIIFIIRIQILINSCCSYIHMYIWIKILCYISNLTINKSWKRKKVLIKTFMYIDNKWLYHHWFDININFLLTSYSWNDIKQKTKKT